MVWYGMVWYGMVWYGMVWYLFHITILSIYPKQSVSIIYLCIKFLEKWKVSEKRYKKKREITLSLFMIYENAS